MPAWRRADAISPRLQGTTTCWSRCSAPQGRAADKLGQQLFEVAIQARPGWRRIGLDVKVASLASVIRRLGESGMELEHVYDY